MAARAVRLAGTLLPVVCQQNKYMYTTAERWFSLPQPGGLSCALSVVVVISTLMQFFVFAVLFTLFMPDLNLNIDTEDNDVVPILLSEILSDPGVHTAIRWAQYLASLLFYPFASLVTTFLYFDLAQRQQVLKMDHLAKFSNKIFGTPLTGTAEHASQAEEEVVEPSEVEILNPDSSKEDKEK